MKTEIIDTHCHLYADEFSEDIEQVIGRAENEGVTRFYLPAIDSSSHDKMLALEARFPRRCFAMIGLHPCSVNENYKEELEQVRSWLEKRKFAGIGETGLDYYWDKTHITEQKEAFEMQIRWALEHKLPLIIHSRDSFDDCISIVQQYQQGDLKGIFHCFSGSYEQAQEAIAAGFLLGIGGVLTFKNGGLAPVVEKLPLEWLVLETDAPYLTPMPFRGKRNESSYLRHVLNKLAEVKGLSIETVAAITTANAKKLFGD